MRTDTHEDPWLLPTHQQDYPTREVLPESRLHGRREGTFLALAALFLVATITLLVLGASQIIDLSAVLSRAIPGLDLPAIQLPLGVLAFPLGFVAVNLVCELYGRRRATALVRIGLVVTLAMVGLMRIAAQVGGVYAPFGTALGFGACYLVAHTCNVLLFDALRRRSGGRSLWLRTIVTPLVGQLVGWVVFAFVLYGYRVQVDGGADQAVISAITALTLGALAYTTVCGVVVVVPVVVAAGSLATYLRVARIAASDDDDHADGPLFTGSPHLAEGSVAATPPGRPAPRRRLPPATIVPDEPVSERRRSARSIQPFNSAEMRFFTEGDEQADLAESSPDLSADARRAGAN